MNKSTETIRKYAYYFLINNEEVMEEADIKELKWALDVEGLQSAIAFTNQLPTQYMNDAHVKLLRDAELAENLVSSLTAMDESAATDKIIIQADGQQISIGLWHIEVIDFLRIFIQSVKELATDELTTMVENLNKQ